MQYSMYIYIVYTNKKTCTLKKKQVAYIFSIMVRTNLYDHGLINPIAFYGNINHVSHETYHLDLMKCYWVDRLNQFPFPSPGLKKGAFFFIPQSKIFV